MNISCSWGRIFFKLDQHTSWMIVDLYQLKIQFILLLSLFVSLLTHLCIGDFWQKIWISQVTRLHFVLFLFIYPHMCPLKTHNSKPESETGIPQMMFFNSWRELFSWFKEEIEKPSALKCVKNVIFNCNVFCCVQRWRLDSFWLVWYQQHNENKEL